MKKFFTFAFFVCTFVITVLAQNECKLCGDWIGTKQECVGPKEYENYKIHVRIRDYDGNISVRVKYYPKNNPNSVKYWGDAEISSFTENNISFVSHYGDDYDWDNSDRMNGRVIYRASYDFLCTIRYLGGTIKLSYKSRATYYDRNNNLIGTEYRPESSYFESVLYKDGEDW